MLTAQLILALITIGSAQDRVIHTTGCLRGYETLSAESISVNDPYLFASNGNLYAVTTEGSKGNSTDIRTTRYKRAYELVNAAYDEHSDDAIEADLRKINRKLRHAGVAEISFSELRQELREGNEKRLYCPRGKNIYLFRKEIRAAVVNALISHAKPSETVAITIDSGEDKDLDEDSAVSKSSASQRPLIQTE